MKTVLKYGKRKYSIELPERVKLVDGGFHQTKFLKDLQLVKLDGDNTHLYFACECPEGCINGLRVINWIEGETDYAKSEPCFCDDKQAFLDIEPICIYCGK